MLPLKIIFIIFINLNLIGFLTIYFYSAPFSGNRSLLASDTCNDSVELEKIYSMINPADAYIFLDPKVAAYVINALDDDHYYPPHNNSNFSKPFIGLKYDQAYCAKWHAYFAQHPEEIFEDYNVLMDFPESHLMRSKVLPKIGNDLQKWVTVNQPAEKKNNFTFNVSAKANGFFFNDLAHNYQQIGKSFACLGQMYNHIPGHASLNRKDSFIEHLTEYNQLYQQRSHCFDSSKFTPQIWIFSVQDQCVDFFTHFNSKEYQKLKRERTIVYLRRVGKNIQPIDDQEESEILRTWGHGELCGQISKNYVIQTRVHNPLLLNDRKSDLRMYMLVASTNPIIAFYHDGLLRVSLFSLDPSAFERRPSFTGVHFEGIEKKDEALKGSFINGLNETELKNSENWNLTELQNFLYATGKISDPNWIENSLRPKLKKFMIHLIKMTQKSFLKLSSVYELFAVDFMLDEDLNLWFIECNSSPLLTSDSEETKEFMIKMLKDHYEIVIGLLRSRAKRMIDYINIVTQEIVENKNDKGKYELRGLAQKKQEWNLLIRNKFEPEFEPSYENGWQKIVDENYEGKTRYLNHISQECL